MEFLAIFGGFSIWYCYYYFECILNGAHNYEGENPWYLPFREMYKDLVYNLPGGRARKLKVMDAETANMWPGPIHFCLTHILLPLSPLIILNFFIITNYK